MKKSVFIIVAVFAFVFLIGYASSVHALNTYLLDNVFENNVTSVNNTLTNNVENNTITTTSANILNTTSTVSNLTNETNTAVTSTNTLNDSTYYGGEQLDTVYQESTPTTVVTPNYTSNSNSLTISDILSILLLVVGLLLILLGIAILIRMKK